MQRFGRKKDKDISSLQEPPSSDIGIRITTNSSSDTTAAFSGQIGYKYDNGPFYGTSQTKTVKFRSSLYIYGTNIQSLTCNGANLDTVDLLKTTKLTSLIFYSTGCSTINWGTSANIISLDTVVCDSNTASNTTKLNSLAALLPSRTSKSWGSITIYNKGIMESVESSFMAKDWYFGSTLLYSSPERIPSAIRELGIPRIWESARYGKDRYIGVMDSSLDSDLTNLTYANITIRGNVADGSGQIADDTGVYHGNKVMSTLIGNGTRYYGVCPQADAIFVRICDKGTSTADGNSVRNGLNHFVNYKSNTGNLDVVNYSYTSSFSSFLADYYTVKLKITHLRERGVLLACAAGNEGGIDSSRLWPKCDSDGVSIGAAISANTIAGYSQGHLGLDFVARTDISVEYKANSSSVLSGTSGATPMFSGIFCLIKNILYYKNNRVEPTIEQVLDVIKKRTYEVPGEDIKRQGYGNINFNAYRTTIPNVPQT